MTATATHTTTGPDALVGDLHPFGPLIVATDGTKSADAALRAAADLAARTGAEVIVLCVLEHLPMVAADYGILLPPMEAEEGRRQALEGRVKAQIAEIASDGANWKVELREGDPATVVARVARDAKARAIVVGLGHHDLLDRVFGSETALHTLRLSRVPVFAVGPRYAGVPTRAVVAIDFSQASVRAARAALQLFDTLTVVYLVHVAPRMELQPEAFAAWMSAYGEGVEPAFARVKAELGFGPDVTVETLTLQGRPAREVLEFARSARVDVIVTGSRGAGFMDRLLVGSTATGLIRGAQYSVLGVPAPLGMARPIELPNARRTTIPELDWARELAAFSRRNAGRRTVLEVDDPDFGAQAQEHDYPFLGAAYDHHDKRVEIMLGEFEGTQHHLTRGISNVHRIDVLQDERGRDWILRIAHGAGQTLLMLA